MEALGTSSTVQWVPLNVVAMWVGKSPIIPQRAEKDLCFESIDLLASSLVATGDTMVLLVKTCNTIVVSWHITLSIFSQPSVCLTNWVCGLHIFCQLEVAGVTWKRFCTAQLGDLSLSFSLQDGGLTMFSAHGHQPSLKSTPTFLYGCNSHSFSIAWCWSPCCQAAAVGYAWQESQTSAGSLEQPGLCLMIGMLIKVTGSRYFETLRFR